MTFPSDAMQPGTSPTGVPLDWWMGRLDKVLEAGALDDATMLVRGLLAERPLHLQAYERALAVTWRNGQGREAADIAGRLLGADPLNVAARSVLARRAELEDGIQADRTRALWQQVWQMHPLHPEMRRQWSRFGADLSLDLPARGFIHMRARHWPAARRAFSELALGWPEREDWQLAHLICTWRDYRNREALTLARLQVDDNRHLLAGWRILSRVGEVADRRVAATYIGMLDPDGNHTRLMLGLGFVPTASTVPQLPIPGNNPRLLRCLGLETFPNDE